MAKVYKDLTGKDWIPPEMSGMPDIESLEQIDKAMKQKPNYSVDVKGREG